MVNEASRGRERPPATTPATPPEPQDTEADRVKPSLPLQDTEADRVNLGPPPLPGRRRPRARSDNLSDTDRSPGFEPPPSVEDAFRGVAAAAEAAGIDLKKLSFDELMRLYETTREYEARMQRDHREYEQAGQELKARNTAADREARFRTVETTVRSVLAGILLIGSVGGVFYGVASGTPAQELTQYLAPITGLAGIAIGYFFGRQSQQ
jgi:hypothetical protein